MGFCLSQGGISVGIRVTSFLLAGAALTAPAGRAQNPPTIVFGTYYSCSHGKSDGADAIYSTGTTRCRS
jgi:hypothetical protein